MHTRTQTFPLTALGGGVEFAITTNPSWIYPVSWTPPGSHVAFVVHLPKNYVPGASYTFNGGDVSEISLRDASNGRSSRTRLPALLVWDRPENGGNGDGLISLADEAVERVIAPGGIALWIDDNCDGIAQATEIHTLADEGIESIAAGEYRRADWTDRAGNRFRYTATIHWSNGKRARSFDVFLDLGEAVPKVMWDHDMEGRTSNGSTADKPPRPS